MADVKNFGLVGVGSNVQFGKAGSKIVLDSGTFKFRNAAANADVAITAAGVTSSGAISAATGVSTTEGGFTATAGDLTLTAQAAKVTIGGDTALSRPQAGVFSFDGTAAFVPPVGNTAARPQAPATGMIRVNNTTAGAATVEYHNGTEWTTLATGGNAAALQTEVDAIGTSLGTVVNSDGTYNGAALTNTTIFGDTTNTSLTAALNNLATYVDGKNTLDEIEPGEGAGKVLYLDSGNLWQQALPGSTSGVQAYDLGLTNLAAKTTTGILIQTGDDTFTSVSLTAPAAGLTISNADGVAGSPTFALANDLAALEGLASTGFAVRTATDTWAQRSLVAPAAGFTITDGDGVAGNPTFALANDLAALEGLTGFGYVVRTGDGTAATRTMNTVSGDLVITGDANGQTTDTTFGLAEVTQANTGTFSKITLDTKGRVTGNTAVVTADITALVDGTYVNVAGDTMTGDLSFGGSFRVTNLASPTAASDAATKGYVDAAVTGLTWKNAVRVYAAAQITLSGTQTIDGVALVAGNRVLVTGQTTDADNGIYVVVDGGAWTRATDADPYTELSGAAVFVTEGTAYANTGWTQNGELTSYAGQDWAQFAGANAYTGGAGVEIAGNTISADIGAGLIDDNGTTIVYTATGNAVQILGGGEVGLVLDTGSGLAQSATGLKIDAASVTNAMLTNSGFTLNADSGTDATGLQLGDTLEIRGTDTQGITTAVTESPAGTSRFVVSALDASSSQKGVAKFDATEFTVTAGNVVLGTIGNSKLANSSITVTGTSGSDAVALGESFAIVSADSALTTTMGANSLSIQLNTVDIAHGGTGLTTFAAQQLVFGSDANGLTQDAALSFDLVGVNALPTLTLGATTINGGTVANPDMVITAATGGDISLVPATGQSVIIAGSVGDSTIQSDTGTALTVRGNTTLTLEAGTGDAIMKLASGTGQKVTVSGPTAVDYATGLAAEDLVNKQYVDTATATGASAGSIKAVALTLGAGTTTASFAMPAGATVLSVKLQVTTIDAAASVTVGHADSLAAYMTSAENDPSTAGMYIAETYITESTAKTVVVTVSDPSTFVGKAIVQYQVAQ